MKLKKKISKVLELPGKEIVWTSRHPSSFHRSNHPFSYEGLHVTSSGGFCLAAYRKDILQIEFFGHDFTAAENEFFEVIGYYPKVLNFGKERGKAIDVTTEFPSRHTNYS